MYISTLNKFDYESTCLFISRSLAPVLAPLGCSDKAESPAPETPPEEQPTPEPEPEKPEFVDANMSMEELMKTEDPDRNYRLVSYRDDTCAMYSFFDL
mgnify:CR=1 FL=1